MIMVVVVQVLSNMNVAELVDFVKVSSTNGELPDGHHLMMIMMLMIRIRIILMMMMIVIILMMIMNASQQILTSHEDHDHDLDNDSIQDDEDAQMVVQCPVPNIQFPTPMSTMSMGKVTDVMISLMEGLLSLSTSPGKLCPSQIGNNYCG